MESKSQYNQDRIVLQLLPNPGNFIDIGAHDGVDLSNTWILEQLGWSGYCFEPLPEVYQKLKINRPKSNCYDCAIGNKTINSTFLVCEGYTEMLSGLVDKYNPAHLERIHREIQSEGGSTKEINVEVKRLIDIIPKDYQIDYLSLDTEGNEKEILEDILLDFAPKVISVEANYDPEIFAIHILLNNKYNFVTKTGCDLIYALK